MKDTETWDGLGVLSINEDSNEPEGPNDHLTFFWDWKDQLDPSKGKDNMKEDEKPSWLTDTEKQKLDVPQAS